MTNQRHPKLKGLMKKLKKRRRKAMTMVMKMLQGTITMATTMERMIITAKTMTRRKRKKTMIRRNQKKLKRERMTKRKEKMSMRVN
jgi:hypothetical protein